MNTDDAKKIDELLKYVANDSNWQYLLNAKVYPIKGLEAHYSINSGEDVLKHNGVALDSLTGQQFFDDYAKGKCSDIVFYNMLFSVLCFIVSVSIAAEQIEKKTKSLGKLLQTSVSNPIELHSTVDWPYDFPIILKVPVQKNNKLEYIKIAVGLNIDAIYSSLKYYNHAKDVPVASKIKGATFQDRDSALRHLSLGDFMSSGLNFKDYKY